MSDSTSNLTADSARGVLERLIDGRDAKVRADLQWFTANLPDDQALEPLEERFAAKILRRNQVLFCVGRIAKDEFRYADIEAMVRERFPDSNRGTVLNVTNALSELADKERGILMRNPRGDAYMLKDPLFRRCIQALLHCADDSEQVEKQ